MRVRRATTVGRVLVNATLVPDTVLLVPGAAGAAEVLAETRAAAVDAVRALVADGPERVVVVAPGPADRTRRGPFTPGLAAAGIDDALLGWSAPGPDAEVTRDTGAGSDPDPDPDPDADAGAGPGADPGTAADARVAAPRVDGPAAATALLLLAHAGWTGPVTLVDVAAPGGGTPPGGGAQPGGGTLPAGVDRAAGLAALGRGLTTGPDRVGVLVAGSLSARRGPAAPLAEDERAGAVDAAMLAALADAGPDARTRLAGLGPRLAAELAVTAWAPWQVAVGAVPDGATPRAAVHHTAAPFGVTYVVASWRAS